MAQLSLSLVEKKGGSVGPSINSCMPLNTSDNLWITDEGSEWLKTGVVIDSTIGYPNATFFADHYVDHGVTYDVGAAVRGSGITWDATNGFWWYYDSLNKQIVQYDADWALTGNTINVAARVTSNAYGLSNDGVHIYVSEQNPRQTEKYNILTKAWVSTHQLNSQGTNLGTYYVNGGCWEGDTFWVRFRSDTTSSTWIQPFDSSFQILADAVKLETGITGYTQTGIAYNPLTKLFYLGDNAKVGVCDRNGVQIDTITDTASGSVSALEWKDDVMYTIGSSTSIVVTAEPVNYIGSPIAYGDENGTPIYTRIK